MQTVNLMGDLGERFGHTHQTRCDNTRDIFRLIGCQQPEFKQYLIDAIDADVGFEIVKGDEILEEEEDLLLSLGKEEELYITAVPAGEKGGGGKIIAAIAIAVVAAFILPGVVLGAGPVTASTASALATAQTIGYTIAVNLALSGLTELLAPGPETDSVNSDNGYLFNGPVNTVKQGLPVPICYGELIVGGSPINTSFQTTPFQINGWQYNTPITGYYGTSPGGGGTATFTNNVYGGVWNNVNILPYELTESFRG